MLVFHKKPAPILFPKQLAIIGQIHHAPINWQLTHWETLSVDYEFQFSIAKGYELDEYIDESLLNEAQRNAQAADLALLCVSTPTDHLSLPQYQLIRSVALVQTEIWVVVWSAASMMLMPWQSKARAILQVTSSCDEQALMKELNANTL